MTSQQRSAGGSGDDAAAPLPSHLRSAVEGRLRERRTQGLAVCTFDADGIRSTDAFGYADLTRSEPVTPGTIFRVASVSKLFTTMLVLRLADAGVLDLEAPLNHYLPEHLRIVDGEGAPAGSTLASVLSHTSGLPVGVRGATPGNAVVSYVANQGRVRNLAEAIAGLSVVRPVGAQVVYSNPAFNVAGYVAAAAMGTTFEAAVHDQVLGPLAMTSAQFAPRDSGPGVATPYGSIVPPAVGAGSAAGLRLVATPMGGLSTNVVELARFGQMVLDGGRIDGEQFLRTATLDAATTLRATNHPDLDAGYGLGFRVRTWHGRRIVGHDGNMPGVATQMMIAPDDGVGVAVLTNGYSLSVPHEIAAMALRHALGGTARTTATVDAHRRGTDPRSGVTRSTASKGCTASATRLPRGWSADSTTQVCGSRSPTRSTVGYDSTATRVRTARRGSCPPGVRDGTGSLRGSMTTPPRSSTNSPTGRTCGSVTPRTCTAARPGAVERSVPGRLSAADQRRSKRSASITLANAAAKSSANLAPASSAA